jgi:hypothetical protein
VAPTTTLFNETTASSSLLNETVASIQTLLNQTSPPVELAHPQQLLSTVPSSTVPPSTTTMHPDIAVVSWLNFLIIRKFFKSEVPISFKLTFYIKNQILVVFATSQLLKLF